ncbi:MAG: glycosyltransferase family 92 protein [Selenomonadaceae bacterium]|nr:glycosyltransferase family 92 protein [Selenomonadaceae bacterium]
MAVEKNLFLHELAAVSLMRNTSAQVKEWLDYHLLAGVDHFYIYDNDSLDNLKEILTPYINAGIVTYIFYPGKNKKVSAYNDAIQNFKFDCRYMTFIDCEEFIFPRKNQSIVEVADEFFGDKDNVGGIELNRYSFSAGNDTVDEGASVLESFKRRGRRPFEVSNTIVNPRKVTFFANVRYANYFDGIFRINDYSGKVIDDADKVSEKIIVNTYKKTAENTKPKPADKPADTSKFILSSFFRSNIFDDGILTYRDERIEKLLPEGTPVIETFAKKIDDAKLLAVLAKTLLPTFDAIDAEKFFKSQENQLQYFRAIAEFYASAPDEFFQNKMETFLTSFNVASYLKKNFLDETAGKFFQDATLNALCQTLCTEFSNGDAQLLLAELPKILPLPYQTVEILLSMCAGMIEKLKENFKALSEEKKNQDIDEVEMETWRKVSELEFLEKMIRVFIIRSAK